VKHAYALFYTQLPILLVVLRDAKPLVENRPSVFTFSLG
jgi:hypothetical protein